MQKSQNANFAHRAIRSVTTWALQTLFALRRNLLQNVHFLRIVQRRIHQLGSKLLGIVGRQQYARTCFANLLQNRHGGFEVTSMKHWQRQSYVTPMAGAVCQIEHARLTLAILSGSHFQVQNTTLKRRVIDRRVQLLLENFYGSLVLHLFWSQHTKLNVLSTMFS